MREFPEGRRVQGARRDQCRVLAHRTPRRGTAWSPIRRAIMAPRWPMRRGSAASRVGGDAREFGESEAGQRAPLRRDDPLLRAERRRARGAVRRGAGGDRRDDDSSVRQRAGHRRPGHGGARAPRIPSGARRRDRAGGRWRPLVRHGHRGARAAAIDTGLRRRTGERRRRGAELPFRSRSSRCALRRRSPTACARPSRRARSRPSGATSPASAPRPRRPSSARCA